MAATGFLGIPGWRWGFYAVALGGLAVAPVRVGVVVGDSMAPAFHAGQVYAFNPYGRRPARGEVVLARVNGRTLLKRVAATAGDEVALLRWQGEETTEMVSAETARRVERAQTRPDYRLAMRVERLRVPAGQVFLLGDGALTSEDSRQFGPVPLAALRGTVIGAPPAQSGGPRLAVLPAGDSGQHVQ